MQYYKFRATHKTDTFLLSQLIKEIRFQIILFANFFNDEIIYLCLPIDLQFLSPGSLTSFLTLKSVLLCKYSSETKRNIWQS